MNDAIGKVIATAKDIQDRTICVNGVLLVGLSEVLLVSIKDYEARNPELTV